MQQREQQNLSLPPKKLIGASDVWEPSSAKSARDQRQKPIAPMSKEDKIKFDPAPAVVIVKKAPDKNHSVLHKK